MVSLLSSDIGTVILLALIVISFVIAFKIMEMVFETVAVSAMSAAFYLVLVYLFNFPLQLQRILLFAFLGATLYMAYSFLASIWFIGSRLVTVPVNILDAALIPFRKIWSYLKKKRRLRQLKDDGEDTEDGKDVKEVVLDKVGND